MSTSFKIIHLHVNHRGHLPTCEIWASHGGKDVDVVLWVVTPCLLKGWYRRFEETCYLHLHPEDKHWHLPTSFCAKYLQFKQCWLFIHLFILGVFNDASTSETSVNFYQTKLCNNPEGSHLHTRRRENLKSHNHPAIRNCRSITCSSNSVIK
jgi:hypothetical protein